MEYKRLPNLQQLNEKYDEDVQTFIYMISMNPTGNEKYKAILKNEYGIDFDEIYKDDDHIKNANIRDIKTKDNFFNFDNYIKYARKIYKLRNLNQPTNINKTLKYDDVENVANDLGFKLEYRPYTGSGNYAEYDLIDTMRIPDEIDVNSLIHEIGHHFDHNLSNGYEGYAKTITHASNPYHIDRSNEVFAENFLHYFIAPDYLKNNLPEVYNELNKNIPKKIKDSIYKLLP